MSKEVHAVEVEEESVGHDEEAVADVGQDSIGHVPEGSVRVDEPDIDLATEVPQEPVEEEEPAPEEPEGTEVPAEAAPEPEEVEEHPEISKEALETEIAEMKEKARIARERAEYWTDAKRQKRAAFFQGRDVEPAVDPTAEVPELIRPQESDFEDYNDFVDALTDYKADLKIAEYDRQVEERAVDTAYTEKRKALFLEIDKGTEKYADFEEIVGDPIVPITEVMIDILADTERPVDITYYLGKNLAEATKISRMQPLAAARAIGLIEAKIADEAPAPEPEPTVPKPPEPKKTTTAPEPITPVKTGGSAVFSKDPSKMSNEEYRAARKAGKI